MKKANLAAILGALILSTICAQAKPMPPFPITRTQSDGSVLTIQQRGDEFFNYIETSDGYLLLADSNGVLYYASHDATISTVRAKNVEERTSADKAFLSTLDQALIKARYELATPRKYFGEPSTSSSSIRVLRKPTILSETSGSKYFLVILVNSFNKSFINSQNAYSNQLNLNGYSVNGHIGSVRDYYIDQSSGAFVPTFDVKGPVTLSKAFSELTDAQIIEQAMASLDASVDFRKYDNDGDGEIDGIAIITAGKEADNGGHGIYQGYIGGAFSKDSKKINKFLMTPELSNNSTTALDGIGSFAHEFGHLLGLMDLYATNGLQIRTPSYWDVMDVGCYNGNSSDGEVYGTVVPNFSAFERQSLGWLTPTELTTTNNIVSLASVDNNKAYTVSTSDTDEWFLVENRQQTGWDAYIPGHGMLIWHIDYDQSTWWNNDLSNTEAHQYVDIEEAKTSSEAAYSYPGTSGIKSFTAFTTWGNTNLSTKIYNILESSGNICFSTSSSVSVTSCTISDATINLATNSGDTVQTVAKSASIQNIIIQTTNGSALTVTGLENTGLKVTTATSNGQLQATISGTATGTAGTYNYTVTASGTNLNDVVLTGKITITSVTRIAAQNPSERNQMNLQGKTLQLFNLKGQLLHTLAFDGAGSGVLTARLLANGKAH